MQLEQRDADIVNKAIKEWHENGIIDDAVRERMEGSIETTDNNRNVLVTFAIVASVSCGLLAFAALVMDEKWIELIRRKFDVSEWSVGALFILLSVALIYLSKRRLKKGNRLQAANEAFNITIVMSVAIALAYVGRAMGYQNGNYAVVLLVAVLLYAFSAIFLRSALLWVAVLIGLVGWWGAQTYAWTGGADYFLGMNYPLRYTVFAMVLLCFVWLMTKFESVFVFQKSSRAAAWFYFMVSSWTLSILGNSNSIESWWQTRQVHFWYWALGYSLLVVAVAVHGFKKKDALLRDLGLVFLMMNIYTRYFEYFWDKTNKGLFFGILAISFWWFARTIEKWRKPVNIPAEKVT